ncbi:hypothetical protein F7725_024219 [Dissostichus mawsoni]|uniref:Cystatin domain-containing protein n=1 Tax=Dissostichus mawsoni TaxID=36200 RepID=A0A7J5Y1N3_DISMA|nr:hypothetical protein F7725_024219 [Dissostichus mawsoni]
MFRYLICAQDLGQCNSSLGKAASPVGTNIPVLKHKRKPNQRRQNSVELIEGARPAVNEHKRQNLLVVTVWWSHNLESFHCAVPKTVRDMMWKIVLPVLAAVFAVDSSNCSGMSMTKGLKMPSTAVVEHNKQSNSMFLSQVAEVVGVKRQLVAGLKYVITVRMGKTPCRKGTANEVCAIHQDPAQALPYQCEFTVLVVPWRNETKMLGQNC